MVSNQGSTKYSYRTQEKQFNETNAPFLYSYIILLIQAWSYASYNVGNFSGTAESFLSRSTKLGLYNQTK